MTYQPREFWEQRLSEQFDLRGTGETGLSLAYNVACYRLRRVVLTRALGDAGFDPAGRPVLDVGCGTGFFTSYYVERGAQVTGLDIAATSIERLRERFPQATFRREDVSDAAIEPRFDLVNVFDVLLHVTDEARWERALRHVAGALRPGGLLLVTDVYDTFSGLAEHNVHRPLDRYRAVLTSAGLAIERLYPTHALLNRDLGPWRFLNRAPWLLYGIDRALLAAGLANFPAANQLLVARRS